MAELYYTPRTYFDSGCTECQRYPVRRKLLDIAYATGHGHDIMEDIHYILDNYPYVSELDIRAAIYGMLEELNHKPSVNYFLGRGNNSLETEAKMLIDDLMKVYRLPADDSRKAYLAESASQISLSEVCAMNGWPKALEQERQPYQMYSYGHWIMFPGDDEIILNYNLNNVSHRKGYISYVYPEPWYGNPIQAKIIVLGSEARYSDDLSRKQNLLLSERAGLCESVQVTVDRWLQLEGGEFCDFLLYDSTDRRLLYNSPTYRFWLERIGQLADFMVLPRRKVYDATAVINANPYTALNIGPLEPGLLPSHYFLRQLMRYIVNNKPKVVFLLPSERLRPIWSRILGDVFDSIIARNRLIATTDGNTIDLLHNWNNKQAELIHNLLR
ncbi:MAG: hypothetical protein HDR99_00470 [Bacteroides sp.]|nr:hypothetical protein [Bacteroides sp.]